MQAPAPAQKITLDVAEIHAQFASHIKRTLLAHRISEEDAEDIYAELLLHVQTTAKGSFDQAKSSLVTFVCGVLLRNAMSAFFAKRREVQDHEWQSPVDADEGDDEDMVGLALVSGAEGDAESRVALEWFERAVGRELADTELTVFSALGVAGVLENAAEDRAPLCADLGMQDQSVVKIINRVKRVVVALWPAHFDTPMPCSRPLRTVEAAPATAVSAPVAAPVAVAEAPAIPAAPLGCPMPPGARDPIVVRLPVPVLELVKAQGKAAVTSAPWPGFAGSRSQGEALRQAA